jgi:hypothetical protein
MDNFGFGVFGLRQGNMNIEMTLQTGYNGTAVLF